MEPLVIDVDNIAEGSFASKKASPAKTTSLYNQWCIHRLSADFLRVRMVDIRNALKFQGGKFGPAYNEVTVAYANAVRKEQKPPPTDGSTHVKPARWLPYTGLKLMKVPRPIPVDAPEELCPVFTREWEIILSTLPGSLSNVSHPRIDFEEAEIQCGCCCSDAAFANMVQCADGHLFCSDCLRRRVEESIYGSLPASGPVKCMDMDGCVNIIPWSEIRRTLDPELVAKFDERQANDSVARARLAGLVYCPVCNFACVVDEGTEVFMCPNESCLKESCLKCKEPSHVPLRCDQVEKPSDTRVRNQIEEIMSKSLIRECTACSAQLVKEDGCNKITCRCGQSMCYLCRQNIKDYQHFCQHVRDPGGLCKTCTKCSLWVQEDANKVVRAAKKTALESQALGDPSLLVREIGPAESFFSNKRMRTN